MENSKEWYKSKTIWASLVTVLISVLGMFGVGGLEDQKETITELIMQIVAVSGGVLAVIGRISANSKIKGKP